jgi:hypothetical protein
MNSIFDKASNEAMISRINTLSPESKPLWGKMSVDQMFKHCSALIEPAFGKSPIKMGFLEETYGSFQCGLALSDSGYGKNSHTAKDFVFSDKYDFETSKKELIEKFIRFANEGAECITTSKHPYWGITKIEDWDCMMTKHLDHHLKQFGV